MFNVDITHEEKERLVKHFTAVLRATCAPNRAISHAFVLDVLRVLQILDTIQPTATEPWTGGSDPGLTSH